MSLIAVWGWLRGNAIWAVPSAIAAALGIYCLILRASNADLRAALANDKVIQAENIARAEAAVRRQMQADIDLGNVIVAKYAGEIAGLQGDKEDALQRLAAAQNSPVCDRNDTTDAFDAGVRALWNRAGKAGSVPLGTSR